MKGVFLEVDNGCVLANLSYSLEGLDYFCKG